ncbi:MAG TPA: STAS domain-containing protein [Anaerolineae bacterium]|nr:STAS domain-containing protein [Anaerolineae bacterium]
MVELETKRLDNGVTRLILTGRLDLEGATDIEHQFLAKTSTEKDLILVDLSGVELIASIGMRLLLSGARAQKQKGGKLVLLCPPSRVHETLVKSGFHQLLTLVSDEGGALAALHH